MYGESMICILKYKRAVSKSQGEKNFGLKTSMNYRRDSRRASITERKEELPGVTATGLLERFYF